MSVSPASKEEPAPPVPRGAVARRGQALLEDLEQAGRKPRTILLSLVVLFLSAGVLTWLSLT